MATPALATLSGDLGLALGASPLGAGTLHLRPVVAAAGYPGGYLMLPGEVSIPVAADGTFSAQVARTDQSVPSGWRYRCQVDAPGLPKSPFYIVVEKAEVTIAEALVPDGGAEQWSVTVVPVSLQIGTVTTGAAGSAASATITGDPGDKFLNLVIPRGATGATGPAPVFTTPTVSKIAAGGTPTVTQTGAGTAASPLKLAFGLVTGDTGPAGPAPVFTTPTVSKLAPGSMPTVTASGDGTAASPLALAFGLVTGDTGSPSTVTAIPANSDLNSYQTTGLYSCDMSATTATITNRPANGIAFLLEVFSSAGHTYQVAHEHSTGTIRYRTRYNTTWSAWFQIPTNATATTSAAGLMSAADKTKLDAQSSTPVLSVAGKTGAVTLAGTDIPAATTSAQGAMTAADKTKLNALVTSDATTSASGYMSATDKAAVDSLKRREVILPAYATGVTGFVDAKNSWDGVHVHVSGRHVHLHGAVNGAVSGSNIFAAPLPAEIRPDYRIAGNNCTVRPSGAVDSTVSGLIDLDAHWILP